MENLNNVHLWKTPLTGRIVIGSVDSKKIVTAQRTLEENEIMNVLTDLIDYMQEKGINTITNTKTGETYLFGKEPVKEKKNG